MYRVIYREMLKIFLSRLLHQMGQYVTWNINRTKELNKLSLASQMATPSGDIFLYRLIQGGGVVIKNPLLMNHWPECIDF